MPARNISGAVLVLGIGGAVLAYSGLTGKGFAGSVRALLAGQSPSTAPQTNPITGSSSSDGTSGQSAGDTQLVPVGDAGPGATESQFLSDVTRGLGAQPTQGTLNGLAAVVQTEGVNNYYNPFNIEWHPGENTAWKGIANWNSVGVQEYGSYQQGVQATVAFLTQNSHWSNVVSAIKSGNQQMVESALTNAYTWAKLKLAGNNASSILAKSVGP